MMLSTTEYKSILKHLEIGDLNKVEKLLKGYARKNPEKGLVLSLYYLETEDHERALKTLTKMIKTYNIIDRNVLFYLTKVMIELGYDIANIMDEVEKLLNSDNLKKFVELTFYLLSNKKDEVNEILKSILTDSIDIYTWYILENGKNNKSNLDRNIIKTVKKLSKSFLPAKITLYNIYKTGDKKTAKSILEEYLRTNPFDKEANLEIANLLLEKKPFIFKERWLRDIVRYLSVKANLEPIKLENYWIYRILQIYFSKLGLIEQSIKWALVEEKLIIMIIESVGAEIASTRNKINENMTDSIETIIELLENKEVTTKREFEKILNKKREIKLIKEMYDLSVDFNNYDDDM